MVSRPTSTQSVSSEKGHYITPITIEVTVEGAVEHPGPYSLQKNAPLRELLDQAKPLPLADLKRMNLDSKLRQGQVVHVKSKEMITIYLEGAVLVPGAHQFPKGTKLSDLKDQALFLPQADLHVLNKKRKLKPNEVLTICIHSE